MTTVLGTVAAELSQRFRRRVLAVDSPRIALLVERVLTLGAMGDHVPLELVLALLLLGASART